MSKKTILITGGAGFIGSHLCDELLSKGHDVRVLDNMQEQVHGSNIVRPSYIHKDVRVFLGDICDAKSVALACRDVDVVFHFAARVGVGQSMYAVSDYTRTNNLGTAVLLEELIRNPVERLIVASSMSVYGEGKYQYPDGRPATAAPRSIERLRNGYWEVTDEAGAVLQPCPTPETKKPALASVYALSKYDQERMALVVSQAYAIPCVALRFFNTYGTRQALSDPYTGVLAIFASRLLNDSPPLLYEDGLQQRDFVYVTDVARACRLAMEAPGIEGEVFNVASGNAYTVRDVASRLASVMGKSEIEAEIVGKYRVGDIRHCFADIQHARECLGYAPQVPLDTGMERLADWLTEQAAVDKVAYANVELSTRGLTV